MNATPAERDTTRRPAPGGLHREVRMRLRQPEQDIVRQPGSVSDAFARLKSTGRSDPAPSPVTARVYTRPDDGVAVP